MFIFVILGIIVGGWVLSHVLSYYADVFFFGFVDWYLDFVRTVRKNGNIQ